MKLPLCFLHRDCLASQQRACPAFMKCQVCSSAVAAGQSGPGDSGIDLACLCSHVLESHVPMLGAQGWLYSGVCVVWSQLRNLSCAFDETCPCSGCGTVLFRTVVSSRLQLFHFKLIDIKNSLPLLQELHSKCSEHLLGSPANRAFPLSQQVLLESAAIGFSSII